MSDGSTADSSLEANPFLQRIINSPRGTWQSTSIRKQSQNCRRRSSSPETAQGSTALILETRNGSPAVTELLLNTTSTESKIRWAVLTGRCFHSAAVVELRRRGRAIRGVWLSSILTENRIAERLSDKLFDGYLGITENSLSFVLQRSLVC